MRTQTAFVILAALFPLTASSATRTVSLPPQVNYAVGVAQVGAELYVANLREGSVSGSVDAVYVLDATTGAMRRTLTQGRVLQHLDWDGTSVWAVKMYSRFERLSPSTGAAVESIALPSGTMAVGLAFDRVAGTLFELGAFSSTEVRLRDRTGVVLRTFNTNRNHTYWSGLAFDGCTLWTSDLNSDELVRFDPMTGAELERVATPDGLYGQIEGLGFDGQALIATDQKGNKVHFIDITPRTCTPSQPPDAGAMTGAGGGAGGTGGGAGGAGGGTPMGAAGGEGAAGQGAAGGGETGEGMVAADGGSADRPALEVPAFSEIDAEQRGCGCEAGAAAAQWFFAVALVVLARRRRAPFAARRAKELQGK